MRPGIDEWTMIVARRERRVEWGDCDPARIVFNPRFFEWFDAQTTLIFETVGLPKRDLLQRPDFAGFPLIETRARFHRAVRFGDLIAIDSRIVTVRKSSFEVEHRLTNGGELSAEGFETRVWTMRDPNDPERMKSHPIPPDILARLGIEVG
jgi:4-hydroxybenzoyl-CoA thioesterase